MAKGPNTVRFNLYLPSEAYKALERLRQLTGKKTIAATLRAALKLYGVTEDNEGRLVLKRV